MSTESRRGGDGPPRIEAIDRALQLLEELAAAGPEGLPLAAVSESTGISKATAYRALATMRSRGFVSQGQAGEYRLGPRALWLGDSYFASDNLQRALRPALLELSRRTEELVHLGTWDGSDVVYLDKVEPTSRAIRVWSVVGQRVPAASTALGRALLAAGDDVDDRLEHYIDLLPPDRHVTPERLAEAVEEARASGFSSEVEENEPGVACMGFALVRGDRAVAAISITSVASRMTPERRLELQDVISRELPPLLPDGVSLYRAAERL